jgi:AcrR family transcriptional regulator
VTKGSAPPEDTSTRLPHRPRLDEPAAEARERILRTAYELFHRDGVTAVGVDRIVAEADVAKTTLYRHFRSKDELVVAVLERHEELWTAGWIELEVERRAASPHERILVTFDVLNEWLRDESFQGCLFINSLLEIHERSNSIRGASVNAIENVHALLRRFAVEAGVPDPVGFAHRIQLLMRGAIVAAVEGQFDAVEQAGLVARRLWQEESPYATGFEGGRKG